jgi:hypothetical protein
MSWQNGNRRIVVYPISQGTIGGILLQPFWQRHIYHSASNPGDKMTVFMFISIKWHLIAMAFCLAAFWMMAFCLAAFCLTAFGLVAFGLAAIGLPAFGLAAFGLAAIGLAAFGLRIEGKVTGAELGK